MAAGTAVTVLVADDHLDRMVEVAAGLRAAGLRVTAVHEALGTIAGESDAERPPEFLTELRRVPGVAAVEPDRTIQIPPPEADVQ
jgi:hypothetical protein